MYTYYGHEEDYDSVILIKSLLDQLSGLANRYATAIDKEAIGANILPNLTKYAYRLTSECRLLYGRNNRAESAPGAKERLRSLGYFIERSEQAVHIIIPLLLPKRDCTAFPELDTLCELLGLYARDIPRFKDCTVIFEHVYSGEQKPRDIRDHDNLESRSVLNVIERFLLTSDSGYYCTNVHMTRFGSWNHTVITLMSGKLDMDVVQKAVTP